MNSVCLIILPHITIKNTRGRYRANPDIMKKTLYAIVAFICIVIFLDACMSSKDVSRKSDTEFTKPENGICFVQLNDGSIRYYASLKLVTGLLKTPYLLADTKTRINPGEITSYFDGIHYAVSQKTFCCGRLSYIALETLPGFAIRVVKGKLNVYAKKYFNGQKAVDEYYLQSGDGKIMAYSPETMNQLVKDNAEAYNFFNSFKTKKAKNMMPKRLLATADIYNNGQLNARN